MAEQRILDKQAFSGTGSAVTPVQPVVDDTSAKALEALGNFAFEAGKSYIVNKTLKDYEDTVGAYARIGEAQRTGDYENIFSGDEGVDKQLTAMLTKLGTETNGIRNAVEQGKLNESVALMRLDEIVNNKMKQFPGWANEIQAKVSQHFPFQTTGFAARRILGIDGKDEKVDKKKEQLNGLVLESIKVARSTMDDDFIFAQTGAGSFEELLTMDENEALARLNGVLENERKRNAAKQMAETATGNVEAIGVANAPIVRLNAERVSSSINNTAKSFINRLNGMSMEQLKSQGPALLTEIDLFVTEQLNGLDRELRTDVNENTPTSIIDPEAKRLKDGLESLLKLTDATRKSGNYDALRRNSQAMRQEEWWKVMPELMTLDAVFGSIAVGTMAKDLTSTGSLLMSTGSKLTGKMYELGYGDPALRDSTNLATASSVFRAEDPAKFWAGVPDSEAVWTASVGATSVLSVFKSLKAGDKGIQGPEAVKMAINAADGMFANLNKEVFRPSQRAEILEGLLDPEVQKYMSPEDKVKADNLFNTGYRDMSNWLFTQNEGSVTNELLKDYPTVYVNGQAVPTKQVFMAPAVDEKGRSTLMPSKQFFTISENGTRLTAIEQRGWPSQYEQTRFNNSLQTYANLWNMYAPVLQRAAKKYYQNKGK